MLFIEEKIVNSLTETRAAAVRIRTFGDVVEGSSIFSVQLVDGRVDEADRALSSLEADSVDQREQTSDDGRSARGSTNG